MASIKRNIFYNILLTGSQVALSLVSLPYIARVLGPYQLGRISFVESVTQYLIISASLGIPVYGIREISKARSDAALLSKTFSELVVIQAVTSFSLLILYALLIIFFQKFHADRQLFYLGMVQLLLSTFIVDWYFQGTENFASISIRSFIMRLVSIIIILIFVKNQSDTYLYYAIWTSSVLINVALSINPYLKHLSFKKLSFKKHIRPIFIFFSTKFFTSVYIILLAVFIGLMEDKVFVAYFTQAYKVYTVSLAFILAFSAVLIPKLSEYYKNNMRDESIRLLTKNFNVIINYSIPLIFIMIFFSEQIVRLVLGDQFLPAKMDLILLSPLLLIISVSNIFSLNVLTPAGKEIKQLKASGFGMVFNLLIVFMLIGKFKDTGAAMALLLTESVVCGFLYYYSYKDLKGVKINFRIGALNILNSVFCFGFVGFLLKTVIHLNILYQQFIVCLGICTAIFLIIEILVIKDPYFIELYLNLNKITDSVINKRAKSESLN